MCENESLFHQNKSILTGRHGGKFLQGGNARGGGSRWPKERVEVVVYIPEPLSNEDIFRRTCGDEHGEWQPYEERRAAVTTVTRTETREYTPGGTIKEAVFDL